METINRWRMKRIVKKSSGVMRTPSENAAVFAGYSASPGGGVFSPKGLEVKLTPNASGYLLFYCAMFARMIPVHRFVWRFFNGPIPEAKYIHHKNHIRNDNRLENLRAVYPGENTALRSGLYARRPLTDRIVWEIKFRYLIVGDSKKKVAKEFKVSEGFVQTIQSNRVWRHV